MDFVQVSRSTLGTYLLGGHVINKAQRGLPTSGTERFIARHPMLTAVGATILVNKPGAAVRTIRRIPSLFKKAELGLDFGEINIDELPLEDRDVGGINVWVIVNNENRQR